MSELSRLRGSEGYGGCDDDMARNYAALPHEYLEEMAELTDEEFGRLARALLRYSIAGEQAELAGNERFYIRRVMMQEDRYQASYDGLAARRSEAARKAAQARWDREADASACGRIQRNANDSNTKTETETKTKIKSNNTTVPRSAERRNRAAGAARLERMKRDMAEMEKAAETGGQPPASGEEDGSA